MVEAKVRLLAASVCVQVTQWSYACLRSQRPLKAQLTAEVAAAMDEDEAGAIRMVFEKKEKAIEHEIDHSPLEMHLEMEVAYNFLSK
jgi:hypothetical protein